jgi:ribosomal protein S18 acetylase RimI-like enzyme
MREHGLRISPATPEDYDAFATLFVELGMGDPVPTRERFTREILPTCLVARPHASAEIVGYAFFAVLDACVYVRHLVAAPSARRQGVGRALMHEVAKIARTRGATRWTLNTRRDNHAALKLYEGLGMARSHVSYALKVLWETVDQARADGVGIEGYVVDSISPDEQTTLEAELAMVSGTLESARQAGGRSLLVARLRKPSGGLASDAQGAAVFDPVFPGAPTFRARSVDAAFALLFAMQTARRPEHDLTHVLFSGDRHVVDGLLAQGATLNAELYVLEGTLESE